MDELLRNATFHELTHAIGLPTPITSPMQRQIGQWVKLGSQIQRGSTIVFSHSSWGHIDEFRPVQPRNQI